MAFDTSNAKAEQFTKQPLAVAVSYISMSIHQASAISSDFTDRMWQAINGELNLSDW